MTDNWCSYTNYMEMVGRGMGVGCVMEGKDDILAKDVIFSEDVILLEKEPYGRGLPTGISQR